MDSRRVFVLIESYNVFEIFLLLGAIISGASGVFFPERASGALEVLPRYVQLIWYISLVAGGLIALYGCIKNIFIERIGITLLMSISFGYVVVVLSAVSNRPLAVGLITTLSFSVACGIRVLQINRILKRGIT